MDPCWYRRLGDDAGDAEPPVSFAGAVPAACATTRSEHCTSRDFHARRRHRAEPTGACWFAGIDFIGETRSRSIVRRDLPRLPRSR